MAQSVSSLCGEIVPCNALYVIASENTGTPRDTVYPWGKGAHKQTSEHYRLRQCDLKSTVCDVAPLLRKLCLLQIPHLHQKNKPWKRLVFYCLRGFRTAKAVPLLCNVNPFGCTRLTFGNNRCKANPRISTIFVVRKSYNRQKNTSYPRILCFFVTISCVFVVGQNL